MNNEVAGSILTVFLVKEKKGIFSRSRTCKNQPLKNNDESNTVIASHSNTENFALDTGYLIGVPSWRNLGNMSALVGCKNEFRRQ